MTNRRARTQVRADKLAAEVAAEIEALELQQREMKQAIRAKKEALRQAEEAAFSDALLELGRYVAELAGAADSTTVAQLNTEIDRGEIGTILRSWSATEDDAEGDAEDAPAAVISEPIVSAPEHPERDDDAA